MGLSRGFGFSWFSRSMFTTLANLVTAIIEKIIKAMDIFFFKYP